MEAASLGHSNRTFEQRAASISEARRRRQVATSEHTTTLVTLQQDEAKRFKLLECGFCNTKEKDRKADEEFIATPCCAGQTKTYRSKRRNGSSSVLGQRKVRNSTEAEEDKGCPFCCRCEACNERFYAFEEEAVVSLLEKDEKERANKKVIDIGWLVGCIFFLLSGVFTNPVYLYVLRPKKKTLKFTPLLSYVAVHA